MNSYALLNLALNVLAVGIEREAVAAKVRELEAAGASQEELVEALRTMRDEALAAAQKAIDKAP